LTIGRHELAEGVAESKWKPDPAGRSRRNETIAPQKVGGIRRSHTIS
jgi:hypothetical protein